MHVRLLDPKLNPRLRRQHHSRGCVHPFKKLPTFAPEEATANTAVLVNRLRSGVSEKTAFECPRRRRHRDSADQRRPWRAAAVTFRALIAFGYPLLAPYKFPLRDKVHARRRNCRRERSVPAQDRKEANRVDFLFRWLSLCDTFEGTSNFMAWLSVFTIFALKSPDIDRDNICSRDSDVGQKEPSMLKLE